LNQVTSASSHHRDALWILGNRQTEISLEWRQFRVRGIGRESSAKIIARHPLHFRGLHGCTGTSDVEANHINPKQRVLKKTPGDLVE
jgi:hypothetical protein